MAKYDGQLGDLNSRIASAKKVVILLPANTTIDILSAGLSLMLSLEKQAKDVKIVSDDIVRVSHSSLYGVGQIQNQFPKQTGNNYIITLSGVVEQNGLVPSLEKLDWYPEGQNLNLVFHTVSGFNFAPTNVSTSHQASNIDLVFVIGASNLMDLGNVYQQNSAQISQLPVINISNSSQNGQFGQINIVDVQAAALSEMMMQIMPGLGLSLDQDIASNIMAGIYDATINLTKNVSPDTFLSLAQAMQAGGKVISPVQQPQVANQGFDLRQLAQNQPQVQLQPLEPIGNGDQFTNPPVVNQVSRSHEEVPAGETVASRGPEYTEFIPGQTVQPIQQPENESPAPDWLTPKVFKGGSLG